MVDCIDRFSGQYRFLSNFYLCKVEYKGIIFPSTENAYQAAKARRKRDMIPFVDLTPSQAKELGRTINLREDWVKVKKLVMFTVCNRKFKIPRLRKCLLETGDAYLEEGNTWNDTYWGVCRGEGLNNLGKILMRIRANIRKER